MHADVAIVGAGLAGLTCAVRLHEAGRSVVVFEASDGVGGRIRTDVVDGFRLDRGFQVLLTGYPAARRWFDLEALELRAFSPGVTIRRAGRFRRVADPLQAPLDGARSLWSTLATPADGLRLLAWRRHLRATPGTALATAPPRPTRELLRARGFSPTIVASFFRPFLTGTFFDRGMTTSSRVTELVFRSFFAGAVAVPALGMQQLPAQLAARLPAGTIRTGAPVVAVGDGVVGVVDAAEIRVAHVVVATEGPGAARLLGDRLHERPAPGRGVVTTYYRAPASPVGGPHLVLDADDGGPVDTLAVLSDVAGPYAPHGGALVAVSTAGVTGATEDVHDRRVRTQLRGWYGGEVDGWDRLTSYRIPYAQPRQDAGDLPCLARRVRVGERTWVCGDHRDTGSIQGALVSGRRCADELLAA
jgi:glycine/D-amino acid oxidase-like deaminating enzyme